MRSTSEACCDIDRRCVLTKLVVKEFLELCTCKLSRETGIPNSRIDLCARHPNLLALPKSNLGYNLFLDIGSTTKCTFRNQKVLDK